MTAIIEREDGGFVALCSELDIASQGTSIEEARANLVEALRLFFETADEAEISRRLHHEVFVAQVEVPVGYVAGSFRQRSLPDSGGGRLSNGTAARRSLHHAWLTNQGKVTVPFQHHSAIRPIEVAV